MPKSKREKEISLTKVKKKGRDTKENLLEEVRKCMGNYANVFVVRLEGLRSGLLKKVRQDFKENSRLFFGKNHLIAAALGKGEEDEIAPGIHKISQCLKGECLLVFSNDSVKDIKKYFTAFTHEDFSKSGTVAPETIEFPEGPLFETPGSMEPLLRKLGMPVKIEKGEIHLLKDFALCHEGETITSEQSRLLKLFEFKLAKFKLDLVAHWTQKKGFVAY